MATIGLDKLYYSKITEDASGNETYATPTVLAKAISAELSVELAEATLYADDVAAEIVKEFKSGTLTLGVDDIGISVAADLTGAQVDKNNVLISGGQDAGSPVAIGFRAKKSNGKYGAIDQNAEERIPCKYLSVGRAENGRAFEREDHLFDIYDANAKIINSGVTYY